MASVREMASPAGQGSMQLGHAKCQPASIFGFDAVPYVAPLRGTGAREKVEKENKKTACPLDQKKRSICERRPSH